MAEQVTEQQEVVEQEQVTQTEKEADASFAAGYNKAKGIEAKVEKPDTEEKTEVTETTEPAQNNVVATVEPVKVFGMTEQEFKTALTQAGQGGVQANVEVRKAFGKIGEISRTLQDLSKNLSAKGGRKITVDKLKRVEAELPGLGAALAQDLSEALDGAEQAQAAAAEKGQQFDPEKYHNEKVAPALSAIETRLAEVTDGIQSSLLSFMHPGWKSYLKTDDFKNWLKTLPDARKTAVIDSPHAEDAGQAIADAKTWAEQQKKAAKKQQNKLEAAVGPQGTGAAPVKQQLDDEAAFRKGYNNVKGK